MLPLLLVLAAQSFSAEEAQLLDRGDVVFRASSSGGRIEMFSAILIPAPPAWLHHHLTDVCASQKRNANMASPRYLLPAQVEPLLTNSNPEPAMRALKPQSCETVSHQALFYTLSDVDMPFPLSDTWMLTRNTSVAPANSDAGRIQAQQVKGGMKTMEMTTELQPHPTGTLYIQRSVYDMGFPVPEFLVRRRKDTVVKQLVELRGRAVAGNTGKR